MLSLLYFKSLKHMVPIRSVIASRISIKQFNTRNSFESISKFTTISNAKFHSSNETDNSYANASVSKRKQFKSIQVKPYIHDYMTAYELGYISNKILKKQLLQTKLKNNKIDPLKIDPNSKSQLRKELYKIKNNETIKNDTVHKNASETTDNVTNKSVNHMKVPFPFNVKSKYIEHVTTVNFIKPKSGLMNEKYVSSNSRMQADESTALEHAEELDATQLGELNNNDIQPFQ